MLDLLISSQQSLSKAKIWGKVLARQLHCTGAMSRFGHIVHVGDIILVREQAKVFVSEKLR